MNEISVTKDLLLLKDAIEGIEGMADKCQEASDSLTILTFEYVMGKPVLGQLRFQNRIIIWSLRNPASLFGNGYFGKPIRDLQNIKGTEFDVPIILDLIEGCYLVESRELFILSKSAKAISFRRIKTLCRKQYDNFDAKYLVSLKC